MGEFVALKLELYHGIVNRDVGGRGTARKINNEFSN
jgi:hypothetical protein